MKALFIVLLFMALAWPSASTSMDFESYCSGWCRARYQDGIYKNGKCACIDYYPINLDNRIESFHRPPSHTFGEVQYGADQMHYATGDD